MELLLSLAVGLTFAAGVWLVLRPRTFSVVLGLTLIGYAVNVLILLSGRLGAKVPPVSLKGAEGLADPLPQALVLTAIVIGFGMIAFLLALALRALGESGDDRVDAPTPRAVDEDAEA
jgi:multisubunit Na+/H+ antiporter MnhC subunit